MEPSACPQGSHSQLCTLVTGASTNEEAKIDAAWTKIAYRDFAPEWLQLISRHAAELGVYL